MTGRILIYLFVVLAVVAIGADLLRFLDTGALAFQSLGETWYKLDQDSLNLSQAIIQRYIWPPIWDPGMTTLLLWPAWALPLIIAIGIWAWGQMRG